MKYSQLRRLSDSEQAELFKGMGGIDYATVHINGEAQPLRFFVDWFKINYNHLCYAYNVLNLNTSSDILSYFNKDFINEMGSAYTWTWLNTSVGATLNKKEQRFLVKELGLTAISVVRHKTAMKNRLKYLRECHGYTSDEASINRINFLSHEDGKPAFHTL